MTIAALSFAVKQWHFESRSRYSRLLREWVSGMYPEFRNIFAVCLCEIWTPIRLDLVIIMSYIKSLGNVATECISTLHYAKYIRFRSGFIDKEKKNNCDWKAIATWSIGFLDGIPTVILGFWHLLSSRQSWDDLLHLTCQDRDSNLLPNR